MCTVLTDLEPDIDLRSVDPGLVAVLGGGDCPWPSRVGCVAVRDRLPPPPLPIVSIVAAVVVKLYLGNECAQAGYVSRDSCVAV